MYAVILYILKNSSTLPSKLSFFNNLQVIRSNKIFSLTIFGKCTAVESNYILSVLSSMPNSIFAKISEVISYSFLRYGLYILPGGGKGKEINLRRRLWIAVSYRTRPWGVGGQYTSEFSLLTYTFLLLSSKESRSRQSEKI